MTVFRRSTIQIPFSDPCAESSLPAIRICMRDGYTPPEDFSMDPDDGLFTWYGEHPGAFPYRMQDCYDRSAEVKSVDVCILENDHLKATFIPSLGAKLRSLYDKDDERELLYANSIIRPCNLAIRNSWTAGGIEWNFGMRGHHPYTSSPVHTALASLEDGTPVLRFYWFERARCCVVQMDAFLPEDARTLFVRTRITNPCSEVVPVYWWTNIAVKMNPGDRVVVPAREFYNAKGLSVGKYPIEFNTDRDQTFPGNGIIARDYFFNVPESSDRFIAQISPDGRGLFETSTSLLKGRKLFIWGDSEGGRKWQNYLTRDDEQGLYDEIQCGLGKTQYECIPMPPHTAWEFLEAFGPIFVNAAKISGDYTGAQSEVLGRIHETVSKEFMEELLLTTRKASLSKAKEILFRGDSYGALELKRREHEGIVAGLMNPHLDFGEVAESELPWLLLLNKRTMGVHHADEVPASYMYQKQWTSLLEEAVSGPDASNWYTHYILGTVYLFDGDFDKAQSSFAMSVRLNKNAWAYYGLAILAEKRRLPDQACGFIAKAYSLKPGDVSLAKEYVRILNHCGRHKELAENYGKLPGFILSDKRSLLYLAISLARSGNVDEAEKILHSGKNGFLTVPDVREGEETVTNLWFEIMRKKGLSPEEAGPPPREIDFRLNARKNET